MFRATPSDALSPLPKTTNRLRFSAQESASLGLAHIKEMAPPAATGIGPIGWKGATSMITENKLATPQATAALLACELLFFACWFLLQEMGLI